MKNLLLFLLLLITINVYSTRTSPMNVSDVEKSYNVKPVFKYCYLSSPNLTFTILAYWDKGKGVVYSFCQDKLNNIEYFTNYNKFIDFLTPPKTHLHKYIIIPIKK